MFGRKLIAKIKYSDVLQFYLFLLREEELSISTVDAIHNLLHPTFELAVKDDIIRKNPATGVMKELKRRTGQTNGVRHALTLEQQRAFMDYVANHPVYYRWWPLFTVLLGTGCRIGEALGLTWDDLDYDKRIIHIISYWRVKKVHLSYFQAENGSGNSHGSYVGRGLRRIPDGV